MTLPNYKEHQDMHAADVKAALEKAGTNLHRLGLDNGYAPTSAHDVLRRACPKLERLVAQILRLEPWQIWPSRYDENGRPLTGLHAVKTKNNG